MDVTQATFPCIELRLVKVLSPVEIPLFIMNRESSNTGERLMVILEAFVMRLCQQHSGCQNAS